MPSKRLPDWASPELSAQGLVPLRWGCALPSPNAPGIKWALGSIAMNTASGGDGIPGELFQVLKDDAVKVLHSICQQIWKTQQWSQDWKISVFIPIPKKGNGKELFHPCATAEFFKFAGIPSAAL